MFFHSLFASYQAFQDAKACSCSEMLIIFQCSARMSSCSTSILSLHGQLELHTENQAPSRVASQRYLPIYQKLTSSLQRSSRKLATHQDFLNTKLSYSFLIKRITPRVRIQKVNTGSHFSSLDVPPDGTTTTENSLPLIARIS